MALTLKIVSPERVVFEGQVESVIVPGTCGLFEILKDHAPIISSLQTGTVSYTPSGAKTLTLPIGGGFVAVQKNSVSLCVETL